MRLLDRVLQKWRARVSRRWVPHAARILDIGCHQGEFLRSLGDRIVQSVGIDPRAHPAAGKRFQLLPENFREPLPFPSGSFDAVVMLATLEHIEDKAPISRECARLLRPGGRVIITVPSTWVDAIVAMLRCFRLADGMSLEEHHGFDPRSTPQIFRESGFHLERHRRFQLGLNHLFVLRRSDQRAAA